LIHDKLSSGEHNPSIAQDAKALDSRIGMAVSAANAVFGENQTLFALTSFRGSGEIEANENLKDEVLRVPLVIAWPEKITPGEQSDAMISTVDFLPTLIELAGGTPPSTVDGFSFAGIIRGEEIDHRDVIFAVDPQSSGDVFCIRDRRFKLVQSWKANPSDTGQTDSTEEMYDLNADPDERRNLHGVSTYQGRRQEYRIQLLTMLHRLGLRLRR
jgi:arylsulfatase A-like enzyme